MARPQYRINHSIENLLNLVSQSSSNIEDLLIVNRTILSTLLSLIPQDKVESFVENTSQTLPGLGDPKLPIWIKTKRKDLGLTQKGLAVRLQQLALKIHPSDIGNLETNKRKELYTQQRVAKLVSVINSLLP